MATLQCTFDDQEFETIIEAVCATYGYQPTITDPANRRGPQLPNPQTKAEFTRAHVIGHLHQIMQDYLHQQAIAAARKTILAV